jgi:transcription antitermination factor NusG
MSDWYAIRTITRQERKVAAGLAERRYPIFLPMETTWRGGERHMDPLIPSYVFVLCELEDFADIHGIEGVCGFVRYVRDDGVAWPAPFPARAILGLQIDERAGAFDTTRQVKAKKYLPKKGDQVRIKAGPYFSFLAKVLSSPRGGRAKLLIEGFDRPRRKTLDVGHLEAA